jgi:hypothetical protein
MNITSKESVLEEIRNNKSLKREISPEITNSPQISFLETLSVPMKLFVWVTQHANFKELEKQKLVVLLFDLLKEML